MEVGSSSTIMCDSAGNMLFYSNGCYIANATHQMMMNGDSIGQKKLETSYCKTSGSPINFGITALPAPEMSNLYYLIYTDLSNPYTMSGFFPLAPITLYYAVIDMTLDNGLGGVTLKHQPIIQDTFSRGMIKAQRHINGKDWWIIMPKSHSNCYWTALLTKNGIDTVFSQCLGVNWGDKDAGGQSSFSPSGKQYARMNFYHGLNIFDFDQSSGLFSNPKQVNIETDTFYFGGLAYAPNSRYIYTSCYSKLYQFDTKANDISSSQVLVGELTTPSNISEKTHFNLMHLMPDGKIYIAGLGGNKHLHVIHSPNCYSQESNLEQYAIPLYARTSNNMSNIPHFRHWSESDSCQAVYTNPSPMEAHQINFFPNPTTNSLMAKGLNVGDRLILWDITGKIERHFLYTGEPFNLADLSPGFYMILVFRENMQIGVYKIAKLTH
jgi:hypothetical protein